MDLQIAARKDWRELAACIGQPELFFYDDHIEEARQICNTCPVFIDCRAARSQLERITKSAHPGIWAGEYWVTRNNVTHSSRARRSA